MMFKCRPKSRSKVVKITSYRKNDEFLSTILCIFTMARWFGIPTYGGPSFFWYSVVMLCMLTALEAGAIWKLVRLLTGFATNVTDGRGFVARLSGTIFYGNAVLSLILSWRVISSWKVISFHWARAEAGEGLYFPPDVRIRVRVIFVSIVIGVCACVEHTMSMISATGLDIPPAEYFHSYILSSHGFLLQPSEYSIWLAIPIFILSKTATILWNFQDLIIILISMGLTSRYHRLNLHVTHIINTQKQLNPDLYVQVLVWRRLREAYVRQAALVRRVDRKLGTLVLLSNFNNFYFICLQLFLGINNVATILWSFQDLLIILVSMGLASRYSRLNRCVAAVTASDKKETDQLKSIQVLRVYTWRKIREAYVKQATLVRRFDQSLGGLVLLSSSGNFYFICLQLFQGITQGLSGLMVKRLYYGVSLLWVCVRFSCVVLYAADVNVSSRQALRYLHACSARCYNVEIDRLQQQLAKDYVALSGKGFFYIDRSILLKMVASMITYELVLIQFDAHDS